MPDGKQPNENYYARRVEALTDTIAFDQLLDYAVETCLVKPLEFDNTLEDLTDEQKIVAQLGTRGIRMAYEIQHSLEAPLPGPISERNRAKGRDIDVDDAYLSPEYYSGPLDRMALKKAEAFGAALIEQSFSILGQDAYSKVEELKSATTEQQQINVLNWLNDRLMKLNIPTSESTTDETEAAPDFTYNPIRLSPKFVGSFPHNDLAPTCLGMSIIAASFLNKAGLDYMHAGVMRTRTESSLIHAKILLEDIPKLTKRYYKEQLPEPFVSSLKKKADEMMEKFKYNRGYHAIVITKLISGSWVQIDPNYDATRIITGENENKRFSETLSYLREMKSVAPGLEVSQYSDSYITQADSYLRTIRTGKPDQLGKTEDIKAFLRDVANDASSIPQAIFDQFIEPYFKTPRRNKRSGYAIESVLTKIGMESPHEDEPMFQKKFYQLFTKYVLMDQTIKEFVDRCQKDPHFLDRRVADIRQLPLMIMPSMAISDFPLNEFNFLQVHPLLELGLPEIRIGLSVLSDFSVYFEEPINPTFWVSNWPSLVPITETMQDGTISEAQQALLSNNVGLMERRMLRYSNSYDIIPKFLQAIEREKE